MLGVVAVPNGVRASRHDASWRSWRAPGARARQLCCARCSIRDSGVALISGQTSRSRCGGGLW